MAQTLSEIRSTLEAAGLRPSKRLGQSFLVDGNLLRTVVKLAELEASQAVLEIGPGTGTLTDELLAAGARVLAVELDGGLVRVLRERYAERSDLGLLHADVLAGKHALNPAILAALGEMGSPTVKLVSNLPYNIAVPVVCECLRHSLAVWRGERPGPAFESLTITVQREVAARLSGQPGSSDYGPVSVLVALMGKLRPGRMLPPQAFWPRPKVTSRMLRIDVSCPSIEELPEMETLLRLLRWAFGQRRKRMGSTARLREAPWPPERIAAALAAADIDPDSRPQTLEPQRFARAAAELAGEAR